VEEQMDREQDDFSLTVTTPDITQWFTDPRQLAKNKGRRLKVHTASGEAFEGTLVELDGEKLVLEDKVREPKPVGKGKHTVIKRYEIPLKEFDKAKVKIQF
jgi:ribosome maturation factor RimP